jgi:DNA-binding NarL/FixJ family response regulator
MAKALRILIVDDQRRTRHSLKALLATKFQFIRMLEAENGVETVKCVKEWLPDIILMDARMPDLDGIEATREIKRQTPSVKVIVLSMFAEYQASALAAGADAFISKGEPPERLLAALSVMVDLKGANQTGQTDQGR